VSGHLALPDVACSEFSVHTRHLTFCVFSFWSPCSGEADVEESDLDKEFDYFIRVYRNEFFRLGTCLLATRLVPFQQQ
jgi:hypothetical protein